MKDALNGDKEEEKDEIENDDDDIDETFLDSLDDEVLSENAEVRDKTESGLGKFKRVLYS